MKVESVVRMLNRRLREVYDYFGYKSPELNDLKSILYANFGGESKYIIKQRNKPVRLSRSKEALAYYESKEGVMEDLPFILEAIRKLGTVKEMAEKYVDPSEYKGYRFTNRDAKELHDTIKKRAEAEYLAKYNDDDIYAEFKAEVDSIESLVEESYRDALADIQKEFEKKPGRGNIAGMQEKYDKIVKRFDEAKQRHEKVTEEVQQAQDFTKSILNPGGRDPFDMGMNP